MSRTIRVWDPLVRIFHWSLVLTFFVSYFTGEEDNALHIDAGYAVLGLIIFRVLWGFVGTRHARFTDFVHSPGTVAGYLKSLASSRPEHHLGHNPAGGWMAIAMLACLFVVTISGLKVYAIEEGLGPLTGTESAITFVSPAVADDDEHEHEIGHGEDEDEEEFWEEIHEGSTNVMLLLIFLHIAGVLLSSRLHHENLVKSMITGNKTPGRDT